MVWLLATRRWKKIEDMITRFDKIHESDGQTDRRTATARRGKNCRKNHSLPLAELHCPPPVFTRRSTMHFGLSMGRCAGSDICWPVRGWPLHGPTDRTFGCCWPAAASGANSNSCVSCSNRYRACLQRSLQIQRRRHWQQIRVYVRVTQPDVPFRGPSLLSFTKASFLRVCSLCRGP